MLTTAQLQTLKAAVLASQDAAIQSAASTRNDTELARLLNLPSAVWIWRSSVSQDEIMQNGFDWVRVDNLSVGKARIWEWLFDNANRAINPTKPNVRAGIDETWKGTAADLAVRAAVYAHCRRLASVAESAFADGLGTEVSPSVTSFEGDVNIGDIGAMWGL